MSRHNQNTIINTTKEIKKRIKPKKKKLKKKTNQVHKYDIYKYTTP